MSHKVTRRRFLETALAGPAVIGVVAEVKEGQAITRPVSVAPDPRRRESLRAAMDEIIPARDGMPAASDVGGLEYLERASLQESQIRADLEQALDALARLSASRFRAAFGIRTGQLTIRSSRSSSGTSSSQAPTRPRTEMPA